MRSKQVAIFLIVAALAFAVGPTLAQGAGATAKAGLAQAQQAAQKWQKDAILVSVSTLEANPDGTAEKWGYIFYSPKAKQGYSIDVKGGKIVNAMEVGPHIKDAVGEFVDSDKAIAEAKKNGLKSKGRPPMSLMVMGQATKQPGTYWSIGMPLNPGDVSVMIEGKTGKFFTSHEVK